MMTEPLTDLELRLAADLTREHQQHTRGRAWDRAGIVAAFRRSKCGDVLLLLAAAFRAAEDLAAETPEAINWPQYWRNDRPPPKSNEPVCVICDRTETICREIHEREVSRGTPDPHKFQATLPPMRERQLWHEAPQW